jgi:hypothetical protein
MPSNCARRGLEGKIGVFSLITEMIVSGFLFLFILVLNLVMAALGYLMEKDDYDPDADLQKINNDPKRFQTSIVLALIEHGSVIALAIMLSILFSPYNLILGIVCVVFRIGEGLIQYISEPNYWKLINIASQYSDASGAEKNSLSELARSLFKTKDIRFKFAMMCWSIGTLAYSIVIATSEALPQVIGWLGIAASLLVGFSTGTRLVKPAAKDLTAIGGLTATLFEIIIGGWLLFSPLI